MDRLREYLDEERGRRSRLATAIGISPSAISMWEQVPSDRVTDVSRATGIPPEQLRPDLASIFAPSNLEKATS